MYAQLHPNYIKSLHSHVQLRIEPGRSSFFYPCRFCDIFLWDTTAFLMSLNYNPDLLKKKGCCVKRIQSSLVNARTICLVWYQKVLVRRHCFWVLCEQTVKERLDNLTDEETVPQTLTFLHFDQERRHLERTKKDFIAMSTMRECKSLWRRDCIVMSSYLWRRWSCV